MPTPKPFRIKDLLLLLMWAIAFSPLYQGLVRTWLDNSNDSHGLVVPMLTGYFIWKKWPDLKESSIRTDERGIWLLIASLALYILSFASGVTVVARSMIVFSLIGLVLYNCGPDIFRKLAFPLFFLIFMIPIPVSIIGLVSLPLQRLATDISTMVIKVASIPVYQEGNMLYFAQTQLEVAEACSGIHSMLAMLMLATMFVYTYRMTLAGAAILLFSTIPIAMIANIARVTGTGILAHFYGARVARGFLHDFSGIAVFLVGLMLLTCTYLILRQFQWGHHPASQHEAN